MSSIVRHDAPTREEWLRLRNTLGIGASEIAAICGLNPSNWTTAFDVWAQKKGYAEPKEESYPMRRGRLVEQALAAEFAQVTGKVAHRTLNIIFTNEKYPNVFCTPDSFTDDDEIVEFKNVSSLPGTQGWGEAWSDVVPVHYLAQVTLQMGILERDHALMGVDFGNREYRVYDVPFDKAFFEAMVARAQHFWRTHVEDDVPPEPVVGEHAAEYIEKLHPKSITQKREATETELRLVRTYAAIRARITFLENVKEDIGNQIRLSIGDSEGITFPGGRAALRDTKFFPHVRYPQAIKRILEIHPELQKIVDEETELTKRRSLYVTMDPAMIEDDVADLNLLTGGTHE